MEYIAHTRENDDKVQTILEHSVNTAKIASSLSVAAFKKIIYNIGLLHDIGKYQVSFQKKIKGADVTVEHSICGAIEAKKFQYRSLSLLMEYCIAGHHSGLPDGGTRIDTESDTTLQGRLKRSTEDYAKYKEEIPILTFSEDEIRAFEEFLICDCPKDNSDMLIEKYAFFTRYCFSCLVDADSLDTAAFCNGEKNETLKSDYIHCLIKLKEKLDSFEVSTKLQKTRTQIQEQAYKKVNIDKKLYLMNMPTGSGKTLCSMRFALERAIKGNKKHIIYVIPFNSIIDQTAEQLSLIFGSDADILRHQSTFLFEDDSDKTEDYKNIAKKAAENWNADIIVTTSVQFFESIFSDKRSKLRKFHNMADSILVFDEAHMMPVEFLQSCLEAVSFLAMYFNSEALFLTATMPDFKRLLQKYVPLMRTEYILELIDDKELFLPFKKCRYHYLGAKPQEEILYMAAQCPSALIVVNKRKTAQQLYKLCSGHKYHLSTYMTAYDRADTICKIKAELSLQREKYPDFHVPPDERMIVISTSLIEAGVDLDFYTVFREIAGLDSILQAGGRCNREGIRDSADVYTFEFDTERTSVSRDERVNLTRGLLEKYSDVSESHCIAEYYRRMYFMKDDSITKKSIHQSCRTLEAIPFRNFGESFHLIDSKQISIAVARDDESKKLIDNLQYTGTSVGIVRKLQKYMFSVYEKEFNDLRFQHAIDDFGTGIWCVTSTDYYDENLGIQFEAKDYILD